MAVPPFHALYAAGSFGVVFPSSSPLPWPSPSAPRLGFLLAPHGVLIDDAAGFAWMLRTGGLHPPEEGLTLRFDAQVSLNAGRLLQRCLGTSFDRTCTG